MDGRAWLPASKLRVLFDDMEADADMIAGEGTGTQRRHIKARYTHTHIYIYIYIYISTYVCLRIYMRRPLTAQEAYELAEAFRKAHRRPGRP
jgi:hypothetical protein